MGGYKEREEIPFYIQMDAEEIIKEVEREEEEIKNHNQIISFKVDIEIIKNLNTSQVKNLTEEVKLDNFQKLTDSNITKCLKQFNGISRRRSY